MAKATVFKHLHNCHAERSCSSGSREQRALGKNVQEGRCSLDS